MEPGSGRVPLLAFLCWYQGCPIAFLQPFSTSWQEGLQPTRTNPTKHHKLLRSNHWNSHLKLSGDCAFVGIYGDQEFKPRKLAYQGLVGVWMFVLNLPDTFSGNLFICERPWGFYLLQAFPQVFPRLSRQDDFALVLLEGADGENIFLTEDFPKDTHFEARAV